MNKFILKCQNALANRAAEMYIDKSVWVLAVIIVGMLLMWGVYQIFGTVVLPSLQTSIEKLFANADNAIGDVSKNTGSTFTPATGDGT